MVSDRVVVIGGGIAGLSCAFRLQRRGVDVQLLEAQAEPGGNVRSEQRGGYLLEKGPHTFLPSADDIFALASEAGLEGEIVASRPAAAKRYIVRHGALHLVPTGPLSFITSRLLSFRGKLKLLTEPFRLQRGSLEDTAEVFFARRFGPEAGRVLAGAFISGVYAGDARLLSAAAAFPLFWRFEQQAGSMIRGAMAYGKQRRLERIAQGIPVDQRPKGLCSFREGLGQLTRTVASQLGERCHLSTPVRRLSLAQGQAVISGDGGEWRAKAVVLAVPPPMASRLLEPVSPSLGRLLAGIRMAPISVTYLGFGGRKAPVPDSFGFLAPRGEGIRTLGILNPSRLFDGRAPEGGDLLTGFVGGMTDPQALELTDHALSEVVRAELEALSRSQVEPDLVEVHRYPEAIPQFMAGHLDRMSEVRHQLGALPGVFLAGNYLRGVGMKDAVGSGFEAADSVTAFLGQA